MAHRDSDFFSRVRFRGNPVANAQSIVESGNARFTMLTPRLIRLEWSATGEFEDRSTFAFPTRDAPPPKFTARVEEELLVIDTGALTLNYRYDSGKFAAANLSITFELNGGRYTWTPGMPEPLNLRGTRRTLDICEGDAALEKGLLSRVGWSLFDDSQAVLFDPDDGWVVPRPDHEVQDWYFFGYGHDYTGALSEYVRFGGPIPLIPRYTLGVWWSRYWAYSDQDLKQLVLDFENHDLPLDVLVIDMDWHTPHAWTGYTWNRELFPNPAAFLQWVHEKGLRTTLNLHPAEGVQHFEEIYPRFAREMGVDPASKEAVPFRIADKQFAKNYFELLHHPLEDEGIDFWWVDWQQGESSEVKGLDPLLWLNHLHFADSTRRGLRPILYSRWAGLGNHRYQLGFSGDTWVGWPALQFQPYFTATASNVAYGWWGHDIGGHMGDATEPELYARWVQYGALSPCLRLHATKDPRAERRPWKYPEGAYQAAKATFHWRYQLVPYIYTMARVAHDTGVSLCRPMYYEYPEQEAAYAARYQYFFGDQMIAAPFVHPADPETGLAAADVWIPEGTWIDYTTKETFTGPGWVRLVGDLDYVPMLMKAGAILPLAAPFDGAPPQLASGTTDAIPQDRVILSVFPGANGSLRLYEDDGLTDAYQQGQYEWTKIVTRMDSPEVWVVHVAPSEGHCGALPDRRGYEIRLEGSCRPDRIVLDGAEVSGWTYEPEMLRTTIQVPKRSKRQSVTVTAVAEGGISAVGEAHNRQLIRSDVNRLLGDQLPGGKSGQALLESVLQGDAPGRTDALARLGGPFVRFVEFTAPEEAAQQLGRAIAGEPADPSEPFDLSLTWTIEQDGRIERHTAQATGATESLILDAPFAFDGRVKTARWHAEAQITWKGETLTYTHQSNHLFPTIYAWNALIYNEDENPIALEQVVDGPSAGGDALAWKPYLQTQDGLINVNQPHGIIFTGEYGEALKAGVPLAGYLATTVVSPDERDVVLQFRTAGSVEFYLNGQPVDEIPAEPEEGIHPMFRKARRTAEMRLHAGRNHLVLSTKPSQQGDRFWFFGGALTTPDNEFMTDLVFEV
jgi:alpha-glucosidase